MRDRKLAFITLWKLNDWGMYNRRDEAILWELSRRDNVSAVLHVEHISFKGLIYKVIEWLKQKDKTTRKVYFYQVLKGFSLKPIALNENKKYNIYSIVSPYTGDSLFFKKLSDLVVEMQYRTINKYFAKLKDKIIIIAYPPSDNLSPAIKGIKHDLLIADFEDDTAERKTDKDRKKQILENYKEILPKCKWVFSTSTSICQKYRDYAGQEITFLPNGVDICNFQSHSHKKNLFQKNNSKVIGYVGIINREIDIDLLEYAISNFPKIDFTLIGFATNELIIDINRLKEKYSNIYYLGQRNYKDIPSYISGFDVLINIKKNDYTTAGGESQKIYEYLLTGKPIVSTPVPPADRFTDIIYIASDKHKFIDMLKIALEENNPDLKKKRIQIAIDNSWTKRVDVILDNVTKLL